VIVLNLAKPTKNDPSFYKRWEIFGKVYNKLDLSKDEIEKTEILVVDQYTIVDLQHIKLLPNLKFIASATTGHSHLNFNPSEHSFKLVTLKGDTHFLDKITSVAEFTILLMLRCARELSPTPFKLAGKRVGIVGNGRIGSQVATICESMRMKVSTYDKLKGKYESFKDTRDEVREIYEQVSPDEEDIGYAFHNPYINQAFKTISSASSIVPFTSVPLNFIETAIGATQESSIRALMESYVSAWGNTIPEDVNPVWYADNQPSSYGMSLDRYLSNYRPYPK